MIKKPISLSLLQHLASVGNREALGYIAVMYLFGIGIPQNIPEGKLRLKIAALSMDRASGWRLAIFLRKGVCGFNQDFQAAEFWRCRVTNWLRSDAELDYNDLNLKRLAFIRYEKWKSVCERIWCITVVDHKLPAIDYRI